MMGTSDDKGTIAQVPVGPVSLDFLTWLSIRLSEVLQWDVTVGESISLPSDGYDPRCHQYLGKVPVPMKQKSTR